MDLTTGNQILYADSSLKFEGSEANDRAGQKRKLSKAFNRHRDLENPEIELIDKTPTKPFESLQKHEQDEN